MISRNNHTRITRTCVFKTSLIVCLLSKCLSRIQNNLMGKYWQVKMRVSIFVKALRTCLLDCWQRNAHYSNKIYFLEFMPDFLRLSCIDRFILFIECCFFILCPQLAAVTVKLTPCREELSRLSSITIIYVFLFGIVPHTHALICWENFSVKVR